MYEIDKFHNVHNIVIIHNIYSANCNQGQYDMKIYASQ